MQASKSEIETLLEIQSIDLDIARFQREFENLQQRAIILNARKKKESVTEKLAKINSLKKDAEKSMRKIEDEDASLQKKEKGVQAAIEAAGNDYRSAEARTKELDGIFKRRNTLKEKRDATKAELDKISELMAQAVSALDELEKTENSAIESFKRDGGALQNNILQAQACRQEKLEQVGPQLADLYEKTSGLFDTVFIGRLEGDKCSVCRSRIEQGRLIDLKNNAPLVTCPSCKRLLIIEGE